MKVEKMLALNKKKSKVKRVFTVVGILILLVIIIVLGSILFLKYKKPSFFNNNFPHLSYTIKDSNFVKNYKEYSLNYEKKQALFDTYRGDFKNKNAKKYLDLGEGPFYNQGVHPDVLKLKDKEGKDIYWMAFTPYPFGRDKYENPFVVKSEDGLKFRKPRGVKNPLVPTPDDYKEGGHLSDTDMVYENGKFMLYYVYNKKEAIGGTKFYLIDSKDGIKWSKPQVVYDTREGYSPAIVRDDKEFKMWHIESEGNMVMSHSNDGYKWTTFTKCNINMGDWLPWHINVDKTDEGYEGLVCARNPKLGTRALFYMKSKDGLNWKVSEKPILFPSKNGWDSEEIYRSSFIKEKDKYRIWYSARGSFYKWHIGYTEYSLNEIKNLNLR